MYVGTDDHMYFHIKHIGQVKITTKHIPKTVLYKWGKFELGSKGI